MSGRCHGTAVAIGGEGVLLLGPSGAGKSDLALRLIDDGAILIADDCVEYARVGSILRLSPPSSIAGIMEIHGIGLLRMPHCEGVALRLVVDCTQTPLERLPESQEFRQESLGVPRIALHPFHASAPAKIRLYMKALERGEALPADWFAQKGNSADAEKQQN